MGILEGRPGVCVEVRVKGVALPEYESGEDGDLDTVTKYIPATSGAPFDVRWQFGDNFVFKNHLIGLEIVIDGQKVEGRLGQPRNILTNTSRTMEGRRLKVGDDWFLEKFTFSELVIDDNYVPKADKDAVIGKVASLGEISVHLYRLKECYALPQGVNALVKPSTPEPLGAVPEESLKGRAISHSVQFAEAELTSRGTWHARYNAQYLDRKPFAVFKFKYRSLKALKDLCIIPRSPSPVPLEDRPLETLTHEELLNLARIQKQRINGTANMKTKAEGGRRTKREHDNSDGDKRSVLEAPPRKAARYSKHLDKRRPQSYLDGVIR